MATPNKKSGNAKKPQVKVSDLKPVKDAQGGRGRATNRSRGPRKQVF